MSVDERQGRQGLAENYAGVFGTRVGFGRAAAVLVVDFINAYTTPSSPLYAPAVVDAVGESVSLLAAARAAAAPVIYTQVIYQEHGLDGGLFVQKIPVLRKMVEGEPLAEIVAPLTPAPEDVRIKKQYASCFFGTTLASTLTALGVDTLILIGCSTSGCIRATAVDGMQHGFRVIIPRECVGDRHPSPHEAALFDVQSKYGEVWGKAEVEAALAASTSASPRGGELELERAREQREEALGEERSAAPEPGAGGAAPGAGAAESDASAQRAGSPGGALAGIRVLDLTHMLSGPYATMMLADLGADVIKVEPPQRGEGTRRLFERDPRYSVEGMGAYFLTLNRNKRSVTVDLKSDEGRQLFYRLVESADVVVDNFSVGVTARLKIDYAHLSAVNPRIITASISGFGGEGPGKSRPAFDLVAQGIGGGMSITGQPDGPPTRAGIPIGDLGGGVMGIIGVLSALVSRAGSGLGQHVDISMQDAQVSLLNYMATMYFLSGEVPGRIGNGHFAHVPYGTFPTSDGYVIVAILTDGFWLRFLEVVEAPELDTETHRNRDQRFANKAAIDAVLAEKFRRRGTAEWIERLEAARIPCAPVNDFAAALNDPQLRSREMIVEVKHPGGERISMPGNPVKLSRTPTTAYTSPPLLGAHNDEVLQALGLSAERIAALSAEGVI